MTPNGARKFCFLLLQTLPTDNFQFWVFSPNSACTEGVLAECNKISMNIARKSLTHCDQKKKQYLGTLALVSSRRNTRLRAHTSVFTIANQHFLIQMAPQPSWPPSLPADCLQARSPQPGVLSQEFAAKIPQPGVSSQSVWGPRWSHYCQGSRFRNCKSLLSDK